MYQQFVGKDYYNTFIADLPNPDMPFTGQFSLHILCISILVLQNHLSDKKAVFRMVLLVLAKTCELVGGTDR